MASPSSTASSPIPGDAYFADLYARFASGGASPTAPSRSPSPISAAAAAAAASPPVPSPPIKHHLHTNHQQHQNHHPYQHQPPHKQPQTQSHRPAPYRPRLEFAPPPQAPYRPSLSFLPSGGTSPQSPLTPESPVRELSTSESASASAREEKYRIPCGEGSPRDEEAEGRDRRASAQKLKRRAQNRAAQRAFRARQAERVAELEREVEGLRGELEMLKASGAGAGTCARCGRGVA